MIIVANVIMKWHIKNAPAGYIYLFSVYYLYLCQCHAHLKSFSTTRIKMNIRASCIKFLYNHHSARLAETFVLTCQEALCTSPWLTAWETTTDDSSEWSPLKTKNRLLVLLFIKLLNSLPMMTMNRSFSLCFRCVCMCKWEKDITKVQMNWSETVCSTEPCPLLPLYCDGPALRCSVLYFNNRGKTPVW